MHVVLRDNIDPAIAALSVILIIVTIAVLALRTLVQHGRAKANRPG